MATLHMSAPWVILYREIEELFKYDEEVHVVYDEADNHVKLFVDDGLKAAGLAKLIPTSRTFGNVTIKISVIPANKKDADGFDLDNTPDEGLFNIIFTGNAAFAFASSVEGIFTNALTYVVFKKKVVQYYNDDLGDAFGQCSTLYQEIAKDIFGERDSTFFCTDREDPDKCDRLHSPLGEWP